MISGLTRARFLLNVFLILLWGVLFCISLLHLFSFQLPFTLSNVGAGYLSWAALLLAIVVLGRKKLPQILFIFAGFFFIGMTMGSFLEPPADPLDHLAESYQRCQQDITSVEHNNRGVWQYGMNAAVLCRATEATDPVGYLQRLDVLNGIFLGMGAAILFLVAVSAGFADRWALLSVVLAFLFFGTSVFSYFRYYSFAPSYSSLCIYWLWIARFFFTRGWKSIVPGLAATAVALPILLVNHIQEAAFLIFLCGFWLIITATEAIADPPRQQDAYSPRQTDIPSRKGIYFFYFFCLILFFCILFLLPQDIRFREFLSSFFFLNYWVQNQDVLFMFNDWHLMGKIWQREYRVLDTLGLFGLLPLLLSPLFFFRERGFHLSSNRVRILLLGILPLLIYCLPLLNFIWLSHCVRTPTHLRYYYRFCYAALAWLPILYAVVYLEYRILRLETVNNAYLNIRRYVQTLIFIAVGCLALLAGSMRSFPIYGKLDFLRLDAKPWWPRWEAMVTATLRSDKKQILTDPITGRVFAGVFGMSTNMSTKRIDDQVVLIEEIDALCAPVSRKFVPGHILILYDEVEIEARNRLYDVLFNYATGTGNDLKSTPSGLNISEIESSNSCIVNLMGFSPSWVPSETGHWNYSSADTKWFYRYHYSDVADIKKELQILAPKNCNIFY